MSDHLHSSQHSPTLNSSSYCFTSAKYSCTSCHRTFHQLKLSSLQVECPHCGSTAYEVPEDHLPEPQRATSMTRDDVTIEDETPNADSWEDISDEMEEERPVEGSSMNIEAAENNQNNAENTQMSPFVIIVRDNMVLLLVDPHALSAFGIDANSAGLQDYEAIIEAFLNNDPNKYGPPPAEEESIKKLEEVNYCGDNEKCVCCTVCQEEYKAEDKLVKLPCDHYYHKDCVVEWLSRHNACPMCRKAI